MNQKTKENSIVQHNTIKATYEGTVSHCLLFWIFVLSQIITTKYIASLCSDYHSNVKVKHRNIQWIQVKSLMWLLLVQTRFILINFDPCVSKAIKSCLNNNRNHNTRKAHSCQARGFILFVDQRYHCEERSATLMTVSSTSHKHTKGNVHHALSRSLIVTSLVHFIYIYDTDAVFTSKIYHVIQCRDVWSAGCGGVRWGRKHTSDS